MINKAIIRLKGAGKLQTLKKRWWQDMYNNETHCPEETDGKERLGMGTVGGPFVILAVGLMIASIISCIERICLRVK